MTASTDSRTRLRRLGQLDLGEWVEIATGNGLWTVQHKIAQAISQPHAQVTVPSCNASGKTHLAARLALAFYDSYQPGTPCEQCDGPCRGAKVITTSSKWEHLRDNLWGEIRMAYPQIRDRVGFEGKLMAGDLHLKHTPDHFIIGQSAQRAEGFQGYHAAHKLIIGDEATSVDEEVSQGITSLMAAGDARLLLIFNPTTPDTWAATKTKSGKTVTIPITAFDTPHFTGEPVPEGANLINQRFLERLKEEGMGEGCFDPETEVLTQRGWIKFPELLQTDRVLSRAPNGAAEWAEITGVHRYPHTGSMLRLDSDSVDLFVTPGHRLPFVGRGLTSVAEMRAEEYISRDCVWVGTDRKPVVFEHGGPGTGFAYRRWEFDPGDFAEFLGWYISEGNTSKNGRGNRNRIVLAQSQGRWETARVRELLLGMGVGTTYSGHQFSFSCAPLAAWLDEYCGRGAANKRIPEWLLDATPDLHVRFLLAYEAGDGHTRPNGSATYTTTSKQLVDDLQSLLARYGVAGGWSYTVHDFPRHGIYHLRRLQRSRNIWLRRNNFHVVPYDGDVWCLSTPHQTFLARRSNRHPFWSGNTYEWTTRVMAEFWQLSDTTLIPEEWVREARTANKMRGVRQVGIDLAVYGSDENVIVVRDGNVVTDLYVHPAMRTDLFFESIVTPIVKDVAPDYVVFDADGVGAGAIGDAMKLKKHMKPGGEVIGFRGNKKISDQFKNMRSTWWWMLRRKFENGSIALDVNDPTLMEQLSQMQYDVPNGAIRIETKAEMRKRGFSSPDRADAVMYAFAFSDDLPTAVETPDPQYVEEELGMISYNERDMWDRHIHGDDGWSDREVDVVTGAPFDF